MIYIKIDKRIPRDIDSLRRLAEVSDVIAEYQHELDEEWIKEIKERLLNLGSTKIKEDGMILQLGMDEYKIIFEQKEPNYKEGYNELMDFWDSISDEEKPLLDKRLKKLGL